MNLQLVGPSCRSAQILGLRSNAALPHVGSWLRFTSKLWRCSLSMNPATRSLFPIAEESLKRVEIVALGERLEGFSVRPVLEVGA